MKQITWDIIRYGRIIHTITRPESIDYAFITQRLFEHGYPKDIHICKLRWLSKNKGTNHGSH